MRPDEIRELSDDEVRTRVAELEEERFRLKFRSATEALEEPLRFRTIRRDIARLKTILRERQLAAARGDAGAAPRAARTATKTSTAAAKGTKRATRRGTAKE